ncbi:MAG: hypothetical protein ACTS68_01110 [Candidatus Hodgkinia cicadicola]
MDKTFLILVNLLVSTESKVNNKNVLLVLIRKFVLLNLVWLKLEERGKMEKVYF